MTVMPAGRSRPAMGGGLVGTKAGASIISSHATGYRATDPNTSNLVATTVAPSRATTRPVRSRLLHELVGWWGLPTIRDNSYASSTVEGQQQVGGLVGQNEGGAINDSHATMVTGQQFVGGLVGENTAGTIEDSYHETGTVTGHREVGGLVGWNTGTGTISNSHATGDVTGTETTFRSTGIGGLVGLNEGGISTSHATGKVAGSERSGEYTGETTGGLVGSNQGGTIGASYATGTVRGKNHIGGLVGWSSGIIRTSYATGSVTVPTKSRRADGVERRWHHQRQLCQGEGIGHGWGCRWAGTPPDKGAPGPAPPCTVMGADDVGGLVGVNINAGVSSPLPPASSGPATPRDQSRANRRLAG